MVAPTHLRAFQALEAAFRTGSLKGAADLLTITPAAVGQRIKALEDYLGVELLMRGRAGLTPAPALRAATQHLRAAFRELEAAADVLDLHRGQEIHIAAASDFAELWLKPRLSRFRATHPNTRFCINGEGDAPLRLGAADCEISFGAASPSANTDMLFRDFVIPISSPENTRRISVLKKRDQLEGFPLLHLDFYKNDPASPGWPQWVVANQFRRTAPERGMRFQRIAPVLEAVFADAGLTLCGLALISEHIESARLSLPFSTVTGVCTQHAFQARFRGDVALRPQVRRFRAWLAEEAAATRTWLANLSGYADL
jgi:LysR family glycine cleavage system transcriptional activator